ncbi:SprB repeat-containing protein [Olleya sp. Bg11-27]|uniref:SprB repeat-containing protein n=1 Tax=Olleya sp. Bg11-27 TaxID=2058135 RepID=UPI000C2FF45A|nr:SprB repeat-containing protein [Olleya sp. Bg11-27]AUC76147.1 hypothetical protein CW732_10920 [Olleya sp. Bg11-27]
MKKVAIIIILLLSCTMCVGQYKYKLESDIQINPAFFNQYTINANITDIDFAYSSFNDTQTTSFLSMTLVRSIQGSTDYSYQVKNSILEYQTEIREIVIERRSANSPYSPLARNYSTSVYNNCISSLYTGSGNPYSLTINYFRLARIFTLLELNNFSGTDNEIKECEPKVLQTFSCGNITSYSVKYALDDNITKELLPYGNHGNSVIIDRNGITGADSSNTIKVWLQYTFNNADISDVLTYNFKNCSPLINSDSSIDTSCFNTNDGSFTVTFDRELKPNEKLTTVTLYRIINNTDYVLEDTLIDQVYTDMTYTWPNPLPAGQYRLVYQSGGDNSPVEYFPIIINAPTPVTFTATWTPEVDCFGDNTGSINIGASGGTGNYEYSLDDGNNWSSFSSISTHLESNLVASTYQLKVRDSNGCVAQQ